jgi:hypothetical protein
MSAAGAIRFEFCISVRSISKIDKNHGLGILLASKAEFRVG